MAEFSELQPLPLPRGVSTSKNNSAEIIKETLGIEIPKPPKVVRLNFWNNAIMALRSPFLRESLRLRLGLKPRSILRSDPTLTTGQYVPEFNTYFYNPDTPSESKDHTAVHENAHAYVHQVNPSIRDYMLKQFLTSAQKFSEGIFESPDEKMLAYKAFEEGFAEWVAIEALGRMMDANPDKIELMHDEKFRQNSIRALAIAKSRKLEIESKLREVLQNDPYVGGHLFMKYAMRMLTESGLSTSQALNLLVQSPPSNLAEIRNPKSYIDSLLGK